jgi:hypothetical protein
MISTIKRTLVLGAFTLMAFAANAQINITEYFVMSKTFNLDLSNRTAEKSVYTKGILNIDYRPDNHNLAITYDPRQISINDAMRHILNQTGGEVVKQFSATEAEQLSKANGTFRGENEK